MSFKPEVKTGGDTQWAGNALRFATQQEAEDYVLDLGLRWTAVVDTRVIEVDEPANYTWVPRYGARAILPRPSEGGDDAA